jgi:hypothetical protein
MTSQRSIKLQLAGHGYVFTQQPRRLFADCLYMCLCMQLHLLPQAMADNGVKANGEAAMAPGISKS